MSLFPDVKRVKADLISGGGIPISCTVKDNVLIPALAATSLKSAPPANLAFLEHNEFANAYISSDGDKVYLGSTGTDFLKVSDASSSTPFLLESRTSGKAAAEYFADKLCITFTADEVTSFAFDKPLKCGTYRCGRLFAADRNNDFRLLWSGEGGVKDWEESVSGAGYIDLQTRLGAIERLFDFDDELVVLRKFGLTRINANGTPENFSIRGEDILPSVTGGTAAAMSDRILFCAGDSLYEYSNGSAKKCENDVMCDISSPQSAFSPDGRRYFLCARSKALNRSVVYVFEPRLNSAYIVDIAANFVAGHENLLLATSDDMLKLQSAQKYAYICKILTFGTANKKTLGAIDIDSAAPVDIEISGDGAVRSFYGVNGRIYAHMRAKQFSLKITATGEVRSFTAEAEVTNDV